MSEETAGQPPVEDSALDRSGAVPEPVPDTDWRETLPETVRAWDEVKNSDSPDKFWDQVANQRSRLGQSIRVPGPDASDTDWTEFYGKINERAGDKLMVKPDPNDPASLDAVYESLGRPQDPSAYEVADLPLDIPAERMGQLQASAHKAGLTPAQFQTMLQEVTTLDAQEQSTQSERLQESIARLKGEWGQVYEERVQNIQAVQESLGAPKQLLDAISSGAVDGDTLSWLHTLSKQLQGEGNNIVPREVSSGGLDKSEALSQADEILKRLSSMPRSDPQYDSLMQKRLKLFEIASN